MTLKKVLDKKVLPALKPTFSDGKENLDEGLNFMIQNAVEVCSSFSHFFTKLKKVYVSKQQVVRILSPPNHVVTNEVAANQLATK